MLQGVEGLVHVSEISWSRLRYASDALKTGQKVKVKARRPCGDPVCCVRGAWSVKGPVTTARRCIAAR